MLIVESGSTGPDFYVPGVDRPFTTIGIGLPDGGVVVQTFELVEGLEREEAMRAFRDLALGMLMEVLMERSQL